jgi:6-phosphofructokinase
MNIGILTSGGDCPGLNAVIRAVTLAAAQRGYTLYGFYDGFEGLRNGEYMILSENSVRSIETKGGTILGTTNKGNFGNVGKLETPSDEAMKSLDQIRAVVNNLQLNAVIAIGGDGSLRIASWIGQNAGIDIIGIPKTIDNDIAFCDTSIGFNTAISNATDAINKIQDTGTSHHRMMIIEVMGRSAGWLALQSGIASGSDIILIPEIPFEYDKVISYLENNIEGRPQALTIVVAEGAKSTDGNENMHESSDELLAVLQKLGYDVRLTVLGHIQRGGQPTVYDIVMGSRLGQKAIELLSQNTKNVAIMIQGDSLETIPIDQVYTATKLVPPDHDMIKAARAMGIYFGD